MFKKILKKKDTDDNKNVLVVALLIHAAKIDENYSTKEKEIIKKAIINLNKISSEKADKVLINAEKKEMESNQIIDFTREIKKKSIEYRMNIIEILWKIVYSDGTNDEYESNLIRRVCGLLYVSDKESGMIKLKVKNQQDKI